MTNADLEQLRVMADTLNEWSVETHELPQFWEFSFEVQSMWITAQRAIAELEKSLAPPIGANL